MSFSLLIKPASSDCNLRCRYCYYRKKSSAPRMGDEVLEQVIRSYMQTEQEIYSMVWHGGEPSLMPCSFFEKAIALQKRYAAKGSRISNSLQTNATIISEELAEFIGRYRFLCGASLDGPPDIHNLYRRTKTDSFTHEMTLQGISTLTKNRVPVNIMVLVSAANVNSPLDVYRYLKNKGFTHIQFIPCMEFDEKGVPFPFSIQAEEWGTFLVAVFNEWYKHDITSISIRLFESVLAGLVHNVAIDCYNSSSCNRYLVVESNGDVYPCDFFVQPEYKLGNIRENSFASILASPAYKSFSANKSRWHEDCSHCEFLKLCMGDCLKFRMYNNMASDNISLLCQGWKIFYRQTLDRFHDLATRLKPQ